MSPSAPAGRCAWDFAVETLPRAGLGLAVTAVMAGRRGDGRAVTRCAVLADPAGALRETVLSVPAAPLRTGVNALRLRSARGDYPVLRLLRIAVDPAGTEPHAQPADHRRFSYAPAGTGPRGNRQGARRESARSSRRGGR